jgi:hypothetical protein
MNLIVKSALAGAIRMLVGNNWWTKVRETVAELSRADIPGDEKRAMAIATLREGGWTLAGWVLNLAIEIAVAVLLKAAERAENK